MKLSASQFLRIIDTLKSDPQLGRRRNPRVGLRAKVNMVPCVEKGPVQRFEVWVRDLSVEGVGFVHCDELDAGSFVVLHFPAKDDTGISVLCQVMRSHRIGPKSVDIGARIDHVLTPEELLAA